jgi:sulfur-oxidizing protein SoxB
MNMYFKMENPAGMRIQELFVQGERLERGKTYKVAFVTEQGVPPKYGHNPHALAITTIGALKKYLAKHTPVHADLRGTVVAV